MSDKNYSATIVGGGLVGPLCALYLSRRGYKVSIYERREDPRIVDITSGKSINLAVSTRGRKALREVGLENKILKCGIPVNGRYLHEINGNNRSILYDPRKKECLYSISRKDLNGVLLEAVEKDPNIEMYFNYKLTSVDLENGILTFLKRGMTEAFEVKADLLVGADGAFSTFRRFMQLTPLFDYSQTYLDHGYVELPISAKAGKTMMENRIHLWPRGKFIMVALPNQGGSWTVTLIMPFTRFEQFDKPEKVLNFFNEVFPDAVDLVGEEQLIEKCLNVKPSTLVSIKCSSFHIGQNAVILGDAAHAMLPFYGQGTNAGFEDCLILNSILDECDDNIPLALQKFTDSRKDDAHVICDLALYNYIEIRDLVTRPTYRIRKAIDDILFKLFPDVWIPLYNSVVFSQMSYKQCAEHRAWQDKVVKQIMIAFTVFISLIITFFVKF